MRRQRTASLYSNRHPSKQHCPEDTACGQCCRCVDILKKKNRVLLDKNVAFGKEKQDYVKEIMRLNKVVKGWQKRAKQFQNLQEVKRRLRLEVKAELEDQRRVDDMITRQKLASGKKERQGLLREKAELLQNLDNLEKRFQKVTTDYKNLEQEYNQLQKDHEKLRKDSGKNSDTLTQLKRRNAQLQYAVKDKTDVITRLQKSLSISQQNYLLQKAKNSDNQLALMRCREEIKAYTKSLESLKKQSNDKKAQIQDLIILNSKLDTRVKDLNSTIASYDMLETSLKTRLQVAQNYATQKQIEARIIQSDYESLCRRSL